MKENVNFLMQRRFEGSLLSGLRDDIHRCDWPWVPKNDCHKASTSNTRIPQWSNPGEDIYILILLHCLSLFERHSLTLPQHTFIMHASTVLALLTASAVQLVAAGGFASTCSDMSYSGTTFTAKCKNTFVDPYFEDAPINLSKCLANVGGKVVICLFLLSCQVIRRFAVRLIS
ncbi:uncharacterized protein CLUP02_11802 [Colletotrichum lupini]|uniref:Cyanovirin-N domain-containing protein n=1 Tax=Colletotrichum lupini TaxID=145971 RepID=A0A9Q8WKM9_9PEZI|nr:uncharacterized protein CLUP02_11802 [Colletotrichum lupini]UQC86302.1 hypothetical protein CLUP02_11802 [Colletotrichum lupini]